MQPMRVIKPFDVLERGALGFGFGREPMPLEPLALETGKEALGHRIVETIAYRPHRRSYTPLTAAPAEFHRGVLAAVNGPQGRLIATLLDELAAAPVEDLHLPMPRDRRLRRLAEMLLTDPTDKSSLTDWAGRIGMSERSLTRLLLREIGMSFGRWRRQLHVILSLQRLAKGESVQTIALDLGYENASGFVTMFRKAVGKPPARYMSDRRAMSAPANEQIPVPVIVLPDAVLTWMRSP
jgi:AraC-like DNA-binding protein